MKQLLFSCKAIGVMLLMAVFISSCQKMASNLPNPKATENKSITRLVSQAPNLSFLEAAVIKAGLAGTLDAPGTFTIFAPTDDAFKAAGFTTVDDVKNADAEVLKQILLYHALGSEVTSSAVQGLNAAPVTTLAGKDFYVTGKNGNVWVNNAKVIFKDVDASNGVIHVIDHVLMPPTQNLVQLAQSNPDLSTLVAAVVQAGAVGLLESDGPFTVFAPTNMAFQNALAALGYSALVDVPNDKLLNILAYHLIGARVFSYNLSDGLMPETVQGGTVTILLNGGAKVKGNGNTTASNIVAVDIVATNGVVHVIDQVLLP